ncbi:MAG: leucine-rich repeat domain-containing protein [Gemmatimonadota bacterium]|nr:leucine-rich repeat domain-containing protein [Gemmatimonadota bacterium]
MWKNLAICLCLAVTLVAATWMGEIGVLEPLSVSAQSTSCPGDFNGDGKVNLADFLAFAGGFGTRSGDASYDARLDMDGSGSVDLSDFLAFAGVFGTRCEDRPRGSVSGDRAALVALYNSTDGPNWVDNTNWLTDAPLEEWYGVETDASGRVVRIRLGRWWDSKKGQWGTTPNDLRGVIPPELGSLTSLKELHLSDNKLTGLIPPELGRLTSLQELNLSTNGLTGSIPPELGRLANLEVLSLYRNRLTRLIPSELGGLAKLERLALQYNILTGPIPPELGGLTRLSILRLDENELTGPIPPQLADLARLTTLDLGWNALTGPIPPEFGGLSDLWELSLRYNELTGPIPPELGNLARLGVLHLDANNLTGPIPPELGKLANLRSLLLYSNGLTGPIPSELSKLTNLTSLSLWGNELTGPIPQWLGGLTELKKLNLNSNNLTGPVPPELGNLSKLEALFLSNNRLTGSIPLNFTGLNRLQTLGCRRTVGVCLPATDAFRAWSLQVEARGNIELAVNIPFCDEIDADALERLFEATNGSGWTRSDGWLEDENLSRWYGVRIDSIGRVAALDLSGNGLSGYVPNAVGSLASLTELKIGNNALAGRLPLTLVGVPLEEFDYAETSLCVVDDAGFRDWLSGIPSYSGPGVQCPPLTEREILKLLYVNTEGVNWRESAGWLTDAPLSEWHGAETDAAGKVVELQLSNNRLSGSLPVELAQLSNLGVLKLSWNRLSGPIPPALGDLGRLEQLSLQGNQLSGSIPSQLGRLSDLQVLVLSYNRLSGLIPSELGDLERLEQLSLQGNQLSGELPRGLGKLGNLATLNIGSNFLSGPIPPELGDLSSLVGLDVVGNKLSGSIPSELGKLGTVVSIKLADNQLTGRVPPQLGALDRLSVLNLSGNQLTGPVPAELGGLDDLQELTFYGNELSGSIPAELGNLANLATLNLGDNEFSGLLPAELGRATRLDSLDLRSNALSGPVPPEFVNLTRLRSLILADNPSLSGPLPPGLTALGQLERFMAGGTRLCRPADAGFDAWFRGIADRRLVRCEGGTGVYITQTVQSWDDPVPLLAGKPALLRVFVTTPGGGAVTMPDVRATFYADGGELHAVDIPASTHTIPVEVTEGNLEASANAEVPSWVIAPGLEMVIEVDPEGVLDPALGVTKRIPDSGRIAVDVRVVPPLHLTLIPILWETEPDASVVESVSAMAADPEGHELLADVRTLLPIAEFTAVAREPVHTSTQNINRRLAQVEAMRIMEGGSGHWMGVWQPNYSSEFSSHPATAGLAYLSGRASMSIRDASTIAHELGHNLSLPHAPCGDPNDVDPWFPHSGGSIGAWGYDFELNALVTPDAADVMSFCTQSLYWISDFFFNKALNHRLANAAATAAKPAAQANPVPTLLLCGGRDKDGVPYLDPGFVVDAVPALPPAGTEYAIVGANADGVPMFSYPFDMPIVGDAEGEETSFVFTLPLQPQWAGDLASITLSGPGGVATLDETTDRPMAILRDLQTGQVRGFLSDLSAGEVAQAAEGAFAAKPGMEVIFSRGIPDLQ